jgi:type IV pilus assembly protein PilN
MTQINLLPWREQERQWRKIQFLITLGVFIGITLIIIVIVHLYQKSLINEEKQRIIYLQTTLGSRQAEYQTLKKQKQKQVAIETELKFMSALRNKSFGAVQIMNELVKITPKTITLDQLMREGSKITIAGRAQSELQITQLMKNMDKSSIFQQPDLTRISAVQGSAGTERVFELVVDEKGGT